MANIFDDLVPSSGRLTLAKPAPNNIFDDIVPTAKPSTAAGAFGRHAMESAVPTIAGLGAGAAVLAAVPTGGLSLLAIPAGIAAGFGASKLQDATLNAAVPEKRQAFVSQLAQDRKAHPIASIAGEIAPSLLTMKPGIPKTLPMVRNAAISAGVQGGLEAGSELAQGQPLNPARIATQAAGGAILNRPTAIGRRMGLAATPETPPPGAGAPLTDAQGRVQRVTEALKAAKPIRQEQEALYTKARGQRLARVMSIRERVGGEHGYRAELGALKGELPKVQFESVRGRIGQEDVDGLFNDINSSNLDPWDTLHAKSGLAKLLSSEGGSVPQRGELAILQQVFGHELVQQALNKRPFLARAGDVALDAANVPRALMASLDLSAPLRQGVFLIGRPKQWVPAVGSMLRQFVSEKAYQASQQQIQARPSFPKMRSARLALTDTGVLMTYREEAFMSRMAGRLPGVKASNRAYTGFLNRLRADVFDDLLTKGEKLGLAEDPVFLNSLGSFINTATGRGGLGPLERSAVALNTVLFSPRLLASRLSLLNPTYYVGLHPQVRKEAITSLLTFASAGASVLGLAKLSGASIGTDPRSADFGKIKVGNTRYDTWGGFQQPIVAAARLMTGQMVSSTTGREFTLGEGYKATTREDIVNRFLKSKHSPVMSLAMALLSGKTAMGEDVRVGPEIADRFIPMFVQNVFEVMREQGLGKAWMAAPAAFGVGVQTYSDPIPQRTTTPTGKPTIKFRQPPSLGETVVNWGTGTHITNIPKDQHAALNQARRTEIQRKMTLDQTKRQVLDTGKPVRIGTTLVYLDRGIVKTKTAGRVQTPMRVYEQQNQPR